MPLTFTVDLSQQHFELRCNQRTRPLDHADLLALVEQCEQSYYSGRPKDYWGRAYDITAELVNLGQRLYHWLDGDEGWLRSPLSTGEPQTLAFELAYSREVQGLNPDTQRIALGLAHLPWELLHNGTTFLLQTQTIPLPPWRIVQQREGQSNVANRPLHLLLMATSPEGIEPVLSYEQEEANIVKATENQPLLLVVEESGSVTGLDTLIRYYPNHYFDIFHLTGHGLIYTEADYGGLAQSLNRSIPENTPCFITEDELGNVQLTTVPDLARAFGDRMPRIIFLSGCHTGEVPDRGSVPSMAQALVQAGAQMVLGWARPVLDRTGIVAAQALYRELAAGSSVEQALKAAVAEMIAQECPDWHLLRVYRDSRPIEQLVTPLGTAKRERLARIQPEQDFLDGHGEVKVASASEFVGRRRPLQRCLRVMNPTSDRVGVFIQGMGGLGKSTLAARLCRRVQTLRLSTQRVVLVGVVNEATLLQSLSSAYERFADIPPLLNLPNTSLNGRLQQFIEAVEALDRPLLLVLDDFEQNIPPSAIEDGTLRPISEAAEVLKALCNALVAMQQEISALSRVIVTCRYRCPFPATLHLERLDRMNPADITKKCRLLPDYSQVRRHPSYDRVLEIADGNPRLLEWLLALVQQPDLDTSALLTELEKTEQQFREDILAKTLVESLTEPEQQFLARLSVFQLPVTREILAAVTSDQTPLDKTLALGLVESAPTPTMPEYRVTRILAPLLEPILTETEWYVTHQAAAQATYRAWWEESESQTEAQGLEIVRLALLSQESEIAAAAGYSIATHWINRSEFVKVLELCRKILICAPDNYQILSTIARSEVVLGLVDAAAAHYKSALDHCPESALLEKADTLHNMAGMIALQGNIEHALELWSQNLEIAECIGDLQKKADTLHEMAGAIALQGDIDRALELWNQDLEILEHLGNVAGKASTLHNMARVIALRGDLKKAFELWNQSLEISETTGNLQGKASNLYDIARLISQQGEIERAFEFWNQSLVIFARIGDVRGKAATLHEMARLNAQQGDVDRAFELWSQSLELYERIGDIQGKAANLNNAAQIIAQQGDVDRAFELWNQSLELYERIGDIQGKAANLNDVAQIIAQQGDIERALSLFDQSLDAYKRIGDVQGEAAVLCQIAKLIGQQGYVNHASDLWNQSLWLYEQIGNVQGIAATLYEMARLFAQQGNTAQAIDLLHQSLEIVERIGNTKGKAATLNAIAVLIAQQGNVEHALVLWNQSLRFYEQIGDVQGKASVLFNMASWTSEENKAHQLDLCLQAAQIFGSVHNYIDLILVLSKLGSIAETNALKYITQALWLCLKIQTPLTQTVQLITCLYEQLHQNDVLKAFLGGLVLLLFEQQDQAHLQIEQIQGLGWDLLAETAGAQGIETQEAFEAWFTQQQLNDPAVVLPQINQRLEAMIGESWVFDRTPLL